ncbi:hypothetical protein [Natrinema sp. DC36]|uniref:hypothetical protein n=1 Tax=Natrinema sp. DC36 TaxID=2878680 RepID=UPI001CF00F83|nr:hypothetical protein [Natrinema sp. DC36]
MSSETKLRSTDGFRAFLAVFLVAVVGVATIGLPIVFGGMTTTVEATEPEPEFESYDSISQAESQLGSADEIYLGENGSAVLRYDDETNVDTLEVGMDVSEGLVHVLVVDDVENPDDELESANFSTILDKQGLSGSGSMVMQQPDDLENFELDVSGEVSEETNEFEGSASGTFDSEATTTGAVSTNGHVTATADRLETSGSVSVDSSEASGADGADEYLDVSLQETSDGYEVDVAREITVDATSADQWSTQEQAERTLWRNYGVYAALLGGSSEIDVTKHDFEERSNGEHRLDIEFTVEYTGVDGGIEERLTDQLASDPTMDLSRSEAQAIATSVTDVDIETLEFMIDERGSSTAVEWDVAIANYDELTVELLDLAEATSTNDQLPAEDLENARTAFEAQQAAALEMNLDWDGSIEQTSSDEMTLDASLTSDTENWDAYIDELESRGVEPPNDVTFDLSAETDGDQLAIDGEFELGAEDLASQAVKNWAQSAQTGPMSPTSPEADQFVSALAESELEVLRVDAGIDDGTVRVEGGARFDDMSTLTETVSESMAISGIATEQDGETASMYVYVDDMGEVDTASATKSDLEQFSVVDSETTVHRAGEWDDDLPAIETEEMSEFLETQDDENTAESGDEDEDDGSDSVPGFGIGIGLASIAGLLTALVLRRRA